MLLTVDSVGMESGWDAGSARQLWYDVARSRM